MKKILLNPRYYILTSLGTIALLGLLSEPVDELPASYWYCTFAVSKIVGFGAVSLMGKLIKIWEKQGKIQLLNNDNL